MKRWILAATVGLISFSALAADAPAEGEKAPTEKTTKHSKKAKKKSEAPKDATEKAPEAK